MAANAKRIQKFGTIEISPVNALQRELTPFPAGSAAVGLVVVSFVIMWWLGTSTLSTGFPLGQDFTSFSSFKDGGSKGRRPLAQGSGNSASSQRPGRKGAREAREIFGRARTGSTGRMRVIGLMASSPLPLSSRGGEGFLFSNCLTQGGARSSLTLGYNQAAPTGLRTDAREPRGILSEEGAGFGLTSQVRH
jgi:hypothetical protein